jgi:hypothetical protein
MSYKIGQPVIVTKDGINKVAIILNQTVVNKSVLYDVLFEDRTATTAVNTSKSKKTYINNTLTEMLCDSKIITPTLNYNDLAERNLLPYIAS